MFDIIDSKKLKPIYLMVYALYITFIILASTVYIAETEMRGKINDDQYEYNLKFPNDGKIEHYDVVRSDISKSGYIDLEYWASTNTLYVETQNIKELEVDCRSIAKEKTNEILDKNYYEETNAYKQYFIEKKVFNVVVDTDHQILISFLDVPYPYKVYVNEMELTEGTDYTYYNGNINTVVPIGHSEVDIYFVIDNTEAPNARYVIDYKMLAPNSPISFDGSYSTDDGVIEDYFWDMGDGTFGTGPLFEHSYIAPGQYTVILTVRDDDGLIDVFSRIIYLNDLDNNDLPDTWEKLYGVSDPDLDDDDDKLSNHDEYLYGTNPVYSDTDNDGYLDGAEVSGGSDPLDSSSIPPKIKKQDTAEHDMTLLLAVAGIIGISLIFVIVIFSFILPKRKIGKVSKKRAKHLKSSKPAKAKIINDPKIKVLQPAKYIASTIPEDIDAEDYQETMDSSKTGDRTRLAEYKLQQEILSRPRKPPIKPVNPSPPNNPPINPGSISTSKNDMTNRSNTDSSHGILDQDMTLPRMFNIKNNCPTCDAKIKVDDEFCQVCGEIIKR